MKSQSGVQLCKCQDIIGGILCIFDGRQSIVVCIYGYMYVHVVSTLFYAGCNSMERNYNKINNVYLEWRYMKK